MIPPSDCAVCGSKDGHHTGPWGHPTCDKCIGQQIEEAFGKIDKQAAQTQHKPMIVGKTEDFDDSSMNSHKIETRKV